MKQQPKPTNRAAYTYAANQPQKEPRRYLLPLISLTALTLGVLYWQLLATKVEYINSADLVSQEVPGKKSRINNQFDLAGVRFGMTPEMVRSLHSEMKTTPDNNGIKVISFPTDDGHLMAWSAAEEHRTHVGDKVIVRQSDRIWRMRHDRIIAIGDVDGEIKNLANFYGRPLETTCTRPVTELAQNCTYTWWGGEGVRMEANFQTRKTAADLVYVVVSTVATDTYVSWRTAEKTNGAYGRRDQNGQIAARQKTAAQKADIFPPYNN